MKRWHLPFGGRFSLKGGRMQRRYIWGVVVLLILASMACSLGGGTASALRVTQTPSEETQPIPITEAVEESPPLKISSEVLRNLDSYRLRFIQSYRVDGEPEQITTVEQEATRNPPAQRTVITQGEESTELVQIEDKFWVCAAAGCAQMTQAGAEAEVGNVLLNPEEFSVQDYKYVGRDTVNGIRSRHYVVAIDPVIMAALTQGGEIATVQADVWISDEASTPQYVTRFIVSWEGTKDGKKFTGKWTYEVYDVNRPIAIEPPEQATGMPEDIPIYEGAAELTIMGKVITYSCADAATTVAEFYRNEMPARGWTAGEESTMGNMIVQEWTKGERKASITIASQESGNTSVMIMLGGHS